MEAVLSELVSEGVEDVIGAAWPDADPVGVIAVVPEVAPPLVGTVTEADGADVVVLVVPEVGGVIKL
jgi:hypothetical protein